MRVAGFGFRTGTTTASLLAALEAALNGGPPPDTLATAADKVQGLEPLARALDLPLHAIAPEVIASETRATPNPRVPARYGHRSLSEAACLAAAGPAARLVVPATPGPDGQATCAIAEGPVP